MKSTIFPDGGTLLSISKLTLNNFRCFEQCSIELHPKLTVIVAENAQGKTALLDAISIAIDVFVTAIASGGKSHGFDRDSVHLSRKGGSKMEPSLPTEFYAEGFANGCKVKWSRSLTKYDVRGRSSKKDMKELIDAADQLRSRAINFSPSAADLPPTLPIVAFYGTGRLWSEHRLTEGKKVPNPTGLSRFSAYLDCLSSSSSFKSFAVWYEDAFNELRNPTSRLLSSEDRIENQIAAVEEAVRTVLKPTGWTSIGWEFLPNRGDGRAPIGGCVVVEHPTHGRIPLSLLSDGVRNIVALVADLAYRCVRLNSHLGEAAARLTPGVVLIDEIDMHLHPRWQQLVVELLQQAFPAMQMILTTHSPQVLSTVDAESIRLIRLDNGNGTTRAPRFQTRGVESADILARLMDVDPVPQVEQACWLSDYRAMVQVGEHESETGHGLWSKIVGHFGEEHPALVEIDTLRRLQAFKHAHRIPHQPVSDHAQD